MSRILAAFLVLGLLFPARPAFAFGDEGHQLVGTIADRLLTDSARQNVTRILALTPTSRSNLRTAATWADCVRSVQKQGNTFKYAPEEKYKEPCASTFPGDEVARMERYVRENWDKCSYQNHSRCHEGYHFVNLPLQASGYTASAVGVADYNIVNALNAAVSKLRGQSVPALFNIVDEKEAIFLIAHFVGDIHQPLHVGSVYLDPQGKIVNPTAASAMNTSTFGGNVIGSSFTNLHSQWDSVPESFLRAESVNKMTEKARKLLQSDGKLADLAVLPSKWAADTLKIASSRAFIGIKFIDNPKTDKTGWLATYDDQSAYLKNQAIIQEEQIIKAGAHLAQILNTIWP